MSKQYYYQTEQAFLNKVYVVCAGNIFRIALSRRCQHAWVNCCATTSDSYMLCPEKISPLTKYLSDTGLS